MDLHHRNYSHFCVIVCHASIVHYRGREMLVRCSCGETAGFEKIWSPKTGLRKDLQARTGLTT